MGQSFLSASRRPAIRWFTYGLLVSLAACDPRPPTMTAADPVYTEEIELWRRARAKTLRAPDSWLTLVGLGWFDDGDNPVGTAQENHVVLPRGKAPPNAGKFVVADGRVTFHPAAGVEVLYDGKPAPPQSLKTDAGGKPTLIELGSLRLYVIERTGRLAVRVRDIESPFLAQFPGLQYFPPAPSWKIQARYEPYAEPKSIEIPNIMGTVFHDESPGAIVFAINGETYSMDTMDNGDNRLLVFADETNGKGTYGGGRFMQLDLPPKAGPIELDFNKAYNPPCVFTPYATCPLAPPEHRIRADVTAGEKAYVKSNN